jgi:hypothetical protein
MSEGPPQNSLEENGGGVEGGKTPEAGEIIPSPEVPLIPPEVPLTMPDNGGRGDGQAKAVAREKILNILRGEMPIGVEDDAAKGRRKGLELNVRDLCAKMSTGNRLRAPTREFDTFHGSDRKFEGLEPTAKGVFGIEGMPGVVVSEEVYYIKDEAHARVAIINDQGEKLYIDNLLPPDVRLAPPDSDRPDFYYQSMIDNRLVRYGSLKDKEGIVALFHEIAHAWNDEAGLAGTKIEQGGVWSQLKSAYTEYFSGTDALQKEWLENKISEERDAWAHGFGMMRFLKSKGFPLATSGISGKLREEAERCLSTYQTTFAGKIDKLKPRRGFVSGKGESPSEIVSRLAKEKLDRLLDDLFGDTSPNEE